MRDAFFDRVALVRIRKILGYLSYYSHDSDEPEMLAVCEALAVHSPHKKEPWIKPQGIAFSDYELHSLIMIHARVLPISLVLETLPDQN